MKTKQKASVEREKLKSLHGLKKIQYIWDYYKLPILVACVILYILGYGIRSRYV